MFHKYYDFFEEKPHVDGVVTTDELINEACRDDFEFSSLDEMFDCYANSRSIIKGELFTCYCFLKKHGLLEEYHNWRDGYEKSIDESQGRS